MNFSTVFTIILVALFLIHPALGITFGVLFFLYAIYTNRHMLPPKPPKSSRKPKIYTDFTLKGDMYMSAEDKAWYMLSNDWKKLKEQVHKRDSYQCVTCGSKQNLNCHHIHYRHLGEEDLEDLTTLCNSCHSKLHKKLGYDRETVYQPQIKGN